MPYRCLHHATYFPSLPLRAVFTSNVTLSRREGPHLLHLTCLAHVYLVPPGVLIVLVSLLSVQPSDEQSASYPESSSACRILLSPVHPALR